MEKAFGKIVKKGNQWFIFSKDGKKKLGGPFSSKDAANKRLREIEHFASKGIQMNLNNIFESFGEKFSPIGVSRPKNDGNSGAPDQQKDGKPLGVNLSDNPAGDRNEQKLIGTIAGLPSPSLLDRRVHFPVETEEQAKAACNRVSRLRQSPDWYNGTVAELYKEVMAGIAEQHPDMNIGMATAKIVVKNPADVNEKEVPGVPTPTLENTGNKNNTKLLAQSLVMQANTDEGRLALAGHLSDQLKLQEQKIKEAMKLAKRLEKEGLTGDEFNTLIGYLQSDVLHELIFQGATANIDRRAELLARMQDRQSG